MSQLPSRIKKRAHLSHAIHYLSGCDPILAKAIKIAGPPIYKMRPAGFSSLLKIIVEQQLSVASAGAIWGRLETSLLPLTPERLLEADEEMLRGFGLSRPKVRYVRALAQDVVEGRLDLSTLARLSDERAMAALQNVTGIGRWTAEIYLLFCLGRPNVWPAGDVAVQAALADIYELEKRPGPDEMDAKAEDWQPLRGVAALILWNYYRHIKKRPVWS